MEELMVIYWSQTGNTEAMAEAIGKGIEEAGKKAKVISVSEISAEALKDVHTFALGCPAMGAEVLEEGEMEPFVTQLEGFANGKRIALFGSYGWGDGEWMRDWEARMKAAGAEIIHGEGIIVQDEPTDEVLALCHEVGREMAK